MDEHDELPNGSNELQGDEEDVHDYGPGGYHPVQIGDTFKNGRYLVERKLGWGYFSTVWLARDTTKEDTFVALKIVRAAPNYTETALDEVQLLKRVHQADFSHPGRRYVVSLLDEFMHTGPNGRHVCMVFEVLGENLVSLMRRYHYRGLPVKLVKQIAIQVMLALDYLHRKCGIVHTDLKPENVLIKIADLDGVMKEVAEEEAHGLRRTSVGQVTNSQPLPSPLRTPSKFRKDSVASIQSANSAKTTSTTSTTSSSSTVSSNSSSINSSANSSTTGGSHSNGSSLGSLHCGSHAANSTTNQPTDQPTNQPIPSIMPVSNGGLGSTLETIPDCEITALEDNRIVVKIADFGNACSVDHHYTEDIQTRQYRSPEVLLGCQWGAGVDCWSLACMIFELLTGDFLFEPQKDKTYSKDEDHIAQVMELLGPLPPPLFKGRHVPLYYDSRKRLRNISKLKVWPLPYVLIGKYGFAEEEVRKICDLLLPLLELDPSARADCGSMLKREWLLGERMFDNIQIDRPPGLPVEVIPGWDREAKRASEPKKSIEEPIRSPVS